MNIRGYCLSKVNGPGLRFVLWTQGCSKGCKNCFNPETWSFEKYKSLTPLEIFRLIKNSNVNGVTITGGDPLEQPEELLELLVLLEGLNLSNGIILFTGYTIDEINKDFLLRKSLNYIDVLIDGRFEKDQRISSSLRGSENQNIIYFSSKIKEEELNIDQEVEVCLEGGKISVTGFPSVDRKFLKEFGVILK
jgi:anaerobic ribonucleoside-triphosphate reductase activating protein